MSCLPSSGCYLSRRPQNNKDIQEYKFNSARRAYQPAPTAMETTTYTIRADPGFEAVYPLSPSDLQISPRAIRQAFIYLNDSHDESKIQNLVVSLQESLKILLKPLDKDKGQITTAYPQLLVRIVRRKDESLPHIVVDRSSSIPFKVVTRRDINFGNLSPTQRFPEEAIQRLIMPLGWMTANCWPGIILRCS